MLYTDHELRTYIIPPSSGTGTWAIVGDLTYTGAMLSVVKCPVVGQFDQSKYPTIKNQIVHLDIAQGFDSYYINFHISLMIGIRKSSHQILELPAQLQAELHQSP